MNASIAQKTRESLGSLIKKPPLTEKLLGRPPFRFLHDIFTELIKHTGFFHGLYSPEELNSENVKDKGSKVAFLQKAVDVVAFTMGRQVGCRPTKVVAGHEPEKTNEFLQLLAAAIIDKRDCSEAVTRVLNGEKPTNENLAAGKKGAGKLKTEDAKPRSRSHSQEREKDRKNGKETEGRRTEEKDGGKKERRKERGGDKDGQRNREKEKSKNKVKKNDQELTNGLVPNGDVNMNGPVEPESQEPQQRIPRPTSAKGSRTRTTANDSDVDGEGVEGGVIQESGESIAVPQSIAANHVSDERPVARAASGVRRRPTQQTQEAEGQVTAAEEETSDPPIPVQRPARPSSARPAPPRVKRMEPREDSDVRIGSGKEKSAPAPVIVEDHGREEEEEEEEEEENTFIVEEIQQPDVVMTAVGHQPTGQEVTPGALVKTIEATQKKLVAASEQKEEQNTISDTHRRKERERVQKEIDKLVASIQGLTSSAHPLGRTMDYVQEDMDAMQKELLTWQKESSQHAATLKREQEVTEREVEPLRRELEELEAQIRDQVELLTEVKSRIVQNDDRIQKMLSGVLFKS